MINRGAIARLGAAAIAGLFLLSAPAALAAATPDTWDGLVEVKSDKFDDAYLAPGADFRSYAKVMIDPTDVAFQKNWLRDYNNDVDLSHRLSDAEAQEILADMQAGFGELLTAAYREAGYEIVTAPGPDVLRLRTSIINVDIAAPDVMAAGRVSNFSREAGRATLVIEARDSMSGAILGRGVDKRDVGDSAFMVRRTSTSNKADFERVFKAWAGLSADALTKLRGMPPINADGQPQK